MMKKKMVRLIGMLSLITLVVAALAGCSPANNSTTNGDPSPAAENAEPVTLSISAAASLTDTMEEMAQLYKGERANISIEYNFGPSGSLQQQIEQGAPVDIFISAAPKQMNELEAKELLLDATRIDLLQNELVLVVPKGFTGIADFTDLTKKDIRLIAIGEPESVPAGKYAQEVFNNLGIWAELENNQKLIMGKDVRQVLAYVENEEVQAGAVYRTDAQISGQVEVAAVAPEGSHSPVIYPVAVIASSVHPQEAKDFIEFLASAQGQDIFEKYGFKTLQ